MQCQRIQTNLGVNAVDEIRGTRPTYSKVISVYLEFFLVICSMRIQN